MKRKFSELEESPDPTPVKKRKLNHEVNGTLVSFRMPDFTSPQQKKREKIISDAEALDILKDFGEEDIDKVTNQNDSNDPKNIQEQEVQPLKTKSEKQVNIAPFKKGKEESFLDLFSEDINVVTEEVEPKFEILDDEYVEDSQELDSQEEAPKNVFDTSNNDFHLFKDTSTQTTFSRSLSSIEKTEEIERLKKLLSEKEEIISTLRKEKNDLESGLKQVFDNSNRINMLLKIHLSHLSSFYGNGNSLQNMQPDPRKNFGLVPNHQRKNLYLNNFHTPTPPTRRKIVPINGKQNVIDKYVKKRL